MNNDRVYVKIGRKYRDAFKSVCALVNSGCVDRSIVLGCRDDRVIETEQYVFEYDGDVETIDTGDVVGMLPVGATWFAGFRGGESDSVMAMWYNLLELVSSNYHKQFSLVEFVQNAVQRDDQELKEYQKLVHRVAEGLNLRVTKVAPATHEDSEEDIYILSLRMEVFIGVGEPRPLLCKVCFSRKGNTFSPVDSREAARIDEYISSVVSKRGSVYNSVDGESETEIVDNVLNSLSKLIDGKMERDFTQSILVANSTDKQTLSELMSNESQDEIAIECKKIKVLGISHVQWVDPAFNVYIDSKKAFLAKVTQDNVITMYCKCTVEGTKLIENNCIVCRDANTGIVTEVYLDPTKEDLGLSREQLEQIQRESSFVDHFFPISCSELARRNIECTRYRCKCNSLVFDDNGKTRYKCPDCPYPEVIYHHPDGTIAYTPLLNFDTASLGVVEQTPESCMICGRDYVKEELDSSFNCRFCADAIKAVEEKAAGKKEKRLYRRYAEMLPLRLRVKSIFKKKYCFENADRLLFFVGGQKYFFDKLTLTDSGLLRGPEKRQ